MMMMMMYEICGILLFSIIPHSINPTPRTQVESVQWTFDNIGGDDQNELTRLADFLTNKEFDMVINLPMRGGGARR